MRLRSRSKRTTAGGKSLTGLQVDQARRLKELEQKNGKLKRLVAELSLDKLVLMDIASGNF
jgi:putative transposase